MNDAPMYPRRELPDGRVAYVFPLTFGRARLVVGAAGALVYEDAW